MARALLDWRRLDLPFSPAFFKWFSAPNAKEAIIKGHILPTDLTLVDCDLARHIRQLTEIANRRHELCHRIAQLEEQSPSQTGSHSSHILSSPITQVGFT